MRKFFFYISALLLAAPNLSSCGDDDDKDEDNSRTTWDKYAEYREGNITWVNQEEARTNPDGTPYFQRLTAPWNINSYILIHWFNDRSETAENLVPLYTSTVATRYVGRNFAYQVFDADSTSTNGTTLAVNGVIEGWQLALQNMHVMDTVEIVIPYQLAYGSSTASSLIPPYSALRFNMRLLDIPSYEIQPE